MGTFLGRILQGTLIQEQFLAALISFCPAFDFEFRCTAQRDVPIRILQSFLYLNSDETFIDFKRNHTGKTFFPNFHFLGEIFIWKHKHFRKTFNYCTES